MLYCMYSHIQSGSPLACIKNEGCSGDTVLEVIGTCNAAVHVGVRWLIGGNTVLASDSL